MFVYYLEHNHGIKFNKRHFFNNYLEVTFHAYADAQAMRPYKMKSDCRVNDSRISEDKLVGYIISCKFSGLKTQDLILSLGLGVCLQELLLNVARHEFVA